MGGDQFFYWVGWVDYLGGGGHKRKKLQISDLQRMSSLKFLFKGNSTTPHRSQAYNLGPLTPEQRRN